jgi:hypothetical protein
MYSEATFKPLSSGNREHKSLATVVLAAKFMAVVGFILKIVQH